MITNEIIKEIEKKKIGKSLWRNFYYMKRAIPIEGQQLERLKKLRLIYARVRRNLNVKYDLEARREFHEIHIISLIKKYTRAEVIPQYWIGRHCLDLFMPRYSLGIEINGGIHYRQFKMLKDNHRDENLKILRIPTTEIPNDESESRIRETILSLKKEKPHQTDKKRRVERDSKLLTILLNDSQFDLATLDNEHQ